MGSTSEHATQLSGNHARFQTRRSSVWLPGGNCVNSPYICHKPHILFWVMQMACFVQKNMPMHARFLPYHNITGSRTRNLCIALQVVVPLSYQCIPFWQLWRICVIYRGDWLSIKFSENDSFRKLFLFFENTFQYLRGISQDILVSHFDSRRSLSSANWRRSTSPILFVSFTQPCDQHDRKIRMIRKGAARWRGHRAWGYRKLILRANLLYVPNIKM